MVMLFGALDEAVITKQLWGGCFVMVTLVLLFRALFCAVSRAFVKPFLCDVWELASPTGQDTQVC